MLGKLNAYEIEDLLHQQLIGRIACYADGVPYIVPVSYAYDGQYIYVHTKEGMKVNMMRTSPEICFETDTMDNTANWKSVIAWGKFQELFDKEEREHALRILVDRILPTVSSETTHLCPNWPFPPTNLNEIKGIVFRVKLTDKTGRFEKNTEYTASTF
jgi:hypothetical protein